MQGNLAKRLISAGLAAPLFLLVLYVGGQTLLLLTLGLLFTGSWELRTLFRRKNLRFPFFPVVLAGLSLLLLAWWGRGDAFLPAVLVVALLLLSAIAVFLPNLYSFADAVTGLFGVLYLGLPLADLLLLRNGYDGWPRLLMTIALIWATDSSAFFAGRFLGKHPLAPLVSPKKTIEGGIAGLVVATIVGGIGAPLIMIPLWGGLLLGFLAGLAGQLGDLTESSLKRWAGRKDSGRLLPGHGGVLDRFDSVLFVLPVVYYYLKAISGL